MSAINSRSGNLFFDFRYKGQRCREYTKLEDTPPNRKRLQKIMERIDAEITLNTFVYKEYFPKSKKVAFFEELDKKVERARLSPGGEDDSLPLLKDFVETWLAEKKIEWRDSYLLTVITNLNNYAIPRLGDKRVNDITKADLLNFRSSLAKEPARKNSPLNAATINKIMTPLRMLLNEAADRFEFTSPYRGIKSLKVQKSDVEPFTLEEVQLILSSVRKDFRAYFAVRFFTGMRTGEVDGLKWRYVDFKNRQILIRETVVDGKMTYTKTDGSQREIRMSQPVYDALREQWQVTQDMDFVFATRNGTPLEHNNVTKRVWYPLLRYLGLKSRRPYQTRHTAATLWLASGENPEWIARQMGHTTTEMLFRVYSRFVPNLTRQDGSAFDRLLQQQLDADRAEAESEPDTGGDHDA